jgi:hypothetical protein
MKFLHWIINSTLTKEVGKHLENRNLSFYTNSNGQKLMKTLNGKMFTIMKE